LTVIFQNGEEFWIERLNFNMVISDAAGIYNSGGQAIKEGFYLIGSVSAQSLPNNDNTQATSIMQLRGQNPARNLELGDRINQIEVRIVKQAGTAGDSNVNVQVCLMMRGVAK